MKPIVNLALRTGFSFKKTFGHLKDVYKYENGVGAIGIAEINNTFSHVNFEKLSKEKGFKPIYGARIEVVNPDLLNKRGNYGPIYMFIAKNKHGLVEINSLVTKAWDNFYYKPMITWDDLNKISDNVFVLADNIQDMSLRIDYIALTPYTSRMIYDLDIPKVYINDNYYFNYDDKYVYQLIAGTQKRGDEYYYKFENKTKPQHILTSEEFYLIWKDTDAIENTYKIADQCEHYSLNKAPMVKYTGRKTVENECLKGAKKLGINLDEEPYKSRYEREISVIYEKEYQDYFLVVADMITKAKKKMLVGPARGSAAGSLVCYLMGITTVNPIKHGLVFERFIDVNRTDLPDIDVDFPDVHREDVVKDLFRTHGKDNVCHISNVNLMKPRSAIGDFGIALRIPKYEVDILKDSIMKRSGGDARAEMTIQDTLDTTEIGKKFIEKYPSMSLVTKAQNHPSHAGKHAAGIIVCNDEIVKYGAVNVREGSIMMEKKAAEYLNLLKIDVLGLRTLSILQECAEIVGKDFKFYYDLPLDDNETFKIFKDMRLNGIFQFEGQAMYNLCKQMGVENFDDIVAITALARPGPLHSGAATKFIERRTGIKPVEFACNNPLYVEITKETYGTIIYQEQLMLIGRNVGKMSWKDVGEIRRSASKSLGEEHFNKYKNVFKDGAIRNGLTEEEVEDVWSGMVTFGSWGMNKSHTVSYGYISYWCAYMKAHYPLEFAVANLRHAKSPESALKILRDSVENDGIDYIPVDPDNSDIDWTVQDGKLVGGLKNIYGIGEKKAKEILLMRAGKKKWTPSVVKKMINPKTDFDTLYPCMDKWGDIYKNPSEYGLAYPPSFIKDADGIGSYVIIGRVTAKDLRDLNEYNELVKRDGKVLEKNNKFLKLVVEDDTDSIICKINRFSFDKLNGSKFAEEIVEGETWLIIKGEIKQDGWRILDIHQLFNLNELE